MHAWIVFYDWRGQNRIRNKLLTNIDFYHIQSIDAAFDEDNLLNYSIVFIITKTKCKKRKICWKLKIKAWKITPFQFIFGNLIVPKRMLRNLYLFHPNAVKLIIKTFKAMIEGSQNEDGTRNSHLEYWRYFGKDLLIIKFWALFSSCLLLQLLLCANVLLDRYQSWISTTSNLL